MTSDVFSGMCMFLRLPFSTNQHILFDKTAGSCWTNPHVVFDKSVWCFWLFCMFFSTYLQVIFCNYLIFKCRIIEKSLEVWKMIFTLAPSH